MKYEKSVLLQRLNNCIVVEKYIEGDKYFVVRKDGKHIDFSLENGFELFGPAKVKKLK